MSTDLYITIPNPDDSTAMPIFDGPAADAAKHLVDGTYQGIDLDGEPVTVTVSGGRATVETHRHGNAAPTGSTLMRIPDGAEAVFRGERSTANVEHQRWQPDGDNGMPAPGYLKDRWTVRTRIGGTLTIRDFETAPYRPSHGSEASFAFQMACDAAAHVASVIGNQTGQQGNDADDDDDDVCSECEGSLDDGEGFDGLCGTCADRAEQQGRWSHWD